MTPLTRALVNRTLSLFPDAGTGDVSVEPIERGGSDRRFYRIHLGNNSLILVKYGNSREENRHYSTLARFLEESDIRVPRIFFHDPDECLIWMEDLGHQDLWSFRFAAWDVRRIFYRKAVDEILKLHAPGTLASAPADLPLQPPFTRELYLWEQAYFFDKCAGRALGISPAEIAALRSLPRLAEIAESLGRSASCLVHRDFQSQNILIHDGEVCLIDIQGMRLGVPQYDLASLLCDPYARLGPDERDEIAGYYLARAGSEGHEPAADFETAYLFCATQRLMQALGAYGFLGLTAGKSAFLEHIPAALESLQAVAAAIPGLEPLAATLGRDDVRRNARCLTGRGSP